MTKEEAKTLQREYIPDDLSRPVSVVYAEDTRATTDKEIYRCCVKIGNDLQSGPMFCGKIAEWISNESFISSFGGYYAICKQHGYLMVAR